MNPAVPSLDSTATEECDELTDLIIQEADRIGDRVSRLMEIARPVPLRRAVVSVNVLVHDGVALLRADPSQRRVDFQLDLDPSLPVIDGDPVRLAEAVGNLLRNLRRRPTRPFSCARGSILRVVFWRPGSIVGWPFDSTSRMTEPGSAKPPKPISLCRLRRQSWRALDWAFS
jgi:hypothetical protein